MCPGDTLKQVDYQTNKTCEKLAKQTDATETRSEIPQSYLPWIHQGQGSLERQTS